MVYLTCAVISLGERGCDQNMDWNGCKSAPLHADVRFHLSGSSAIQPFTASEESSHRVSCRFSFTGYPSEILYWSEILAPEQQPGWTHAGVTRAGMTFCGGIT